MIVKFLCLLILRLVNLTIYEGRYNLNELHNASGNANKHRPSIWVNNAKVVDLISKFSKAENPALVKVRGGNKPGTWAVKEVVFAYASWISPEFHKAVLDTFTAATEGKGTKAVIIAQSAARVEGKAGIPALKVQIWNLRLTTQICVVEEMAQKRVINIIEIPVINYGKSRSNHC